VFAALCAIAALAAQGARPTLVLVNARIYTASAAQPWAEELAIAGDRILAVGKTAEIRRLSGNSHEGQPTRAALRESALHDCRRPDRVRVLRARCAVRPER
jgi:hypothetical protein